MKYLLDDDVFKLTYLFKDKNVIFEFELFCTFNNIHTISDLLKHGEKARNERALKEIIEEFKNIKLKFDDELTEKELEERNSERKRIEMESRRKRAQERVEKLLKKEIETLGLPSGINRKLRAREIYKIHELIDGSSYIFFGQDSTIFKESELNKIIKALKEHGLYLNMLNPVTETLDVVSSVDLEPDTISPEKASKTEKAVPAEKRKRVKWEDRINYIKVFYNYFGHTLISEKFTAADNIGKWVATTRSAWKNGKLSAEKIEDLEQTGMSKEGIGISSESKTRMLKSLNIRKITIKEKILYTYYIDGTIKSTTDEEFIKMLRGEELQETNEGIIDIPDEIMEAVKNSSEPYTDEEMEILMQQVFETTPDEEVMESTEELEDGTNIKLVPEQEEHSLDLYSLMQARIEEMMAKKQAISEENEIKRFLIEEYRDKLLHELDSLIQESMQLDIEINSIIGINNSIEAAITSQTSGESQETAEQIKQQIEEITEENERKKALIQEYRKVEEELKRVQNESEELDSQITFISNQTDESKVKKLGEK